MRRINAKDLCSRPSRLSLARETPSRGTTPGSAGICAKHAEFAHRFPALGASCTGRLRFERRLENRARHAARDVLTDGDYQDLPADVLRAAQLAQAASDTGIPVMGDYVSFMIGGVADRVFGNMTAARDHDVTIREIHRAPVELVAALLVVDRGVVVVVPVRVLALRPVPRPARLARPPRSPAAPTSSSTVTILRAL